MTDEWLDDDKGLEKAQTEQEALADAETWTPEPGDVLKGTVLSGRRISSEYGALNIISIVDKDKTIWNVWCGRTILRGLVGELYPKPGKGIKIKYVGLKQPKKTGGNAFHFYVMEVQESDKGYWEDIVSDFETKMLKELAAEAEKPHNPLEDPF